LIRKPPGREFRKIISVFRMFPLASDAGAHLCRRHVFRFARPFWFVLALVLALPSRAAGPTEFREWTAKAGSKVGAKAVSLTRGVVKLERIDGSTISVALGQLAEADQALVSKHFQDGNAPAPAADVKPPAGDLPHPLGQATGELKCGAYGYYLYFPTSLRQGEKHPVLFLMHPQGGSPATFGSYRPAAERNRWILAVSKDSKNGFKESDAANDAMFEKVMKTLPVDPKRIYSSGFSGGGAQALHLAARHKEIAGVIPCGMGGAPGSARQAV
jgi:hypothetical protein